MKRFFSALLIVSLVISLAACNAAAPSDSQAQSSAAAPANSSAAPVPADSSAAPAANAAPADAEAKEAPMLAEQVAAGTLPPLEERMPAAADVMVEPDVVGLGQYGGNVTTSTNDNGRWAWGPTTEQNMFRFKQDGSGEVEANVAKEFSANADSTVWTIKLREGMRWSDGEPFTADDVIFYYDHMSTPALNEDRSPVAVDAEGFFNAYTTKPYMCYQVTVDGVNYWAEFAKVSDYEFTVTFKAPKPSFAVDVAVDNKWMYLPKHFYKAYVARKDGVADDESFPLITEEEALANGKADFGKEWETYEAMSRDLGYYHWDYARVPQIRGFIAVKDNWNAVGEDYVLVRNPYFWKTDSEGRQLPYLDSITYKIINDENQKNLAAMGGELDFYENIVIDFSTVATALKDTHTVNEWITAQWSTDENLMLNQTVKDLDKRALFQDVRFRQALSIAVDRSLLNDTLRNGMSFPAQAAAAGQDAWQQEYIQYDPAAASALLDEITEPWDGAAGTYRKMKGTDKDVEIIVSIKEPSTSGDFISLLITAYGAVGVKLTEKVDADYRTTMLGNDVEASVEVTSASTPAIRPDSIIPMRNVAVWHSAWGKWYEDGKSTANGGIEPTGDAMELVNLYDAMRAATGSDRNAVLADSVQKIYDLHAKNLWIIGYLAPLPIRHLVNTNVQNFPTGLMYVDEFRFMQMARPEQWWRSDAQ